MATPLTFKLKILIYLPASNMINSGTTAKIASNTIYQIVGKIATLSITVLGTILITRYYGREAYGAFSLMQSWPALVFIIVDFGLNAIATRELSKDFSQAGKYIGNILVMRALFSVLFILLMWAALIFFPYSEGLKFGIRLSLFLILTQSLFTTTNIVFQTKMRYDLSTIALVSGYVAVLTLLLLFSYLRLDIAWISFIYVVGGALTFLIAYNLLTKLDVHVSFAVDKKLMGSLFWQTLPIGVMFIFSQVNFKIDEILLSLLSIPSKYGLNNTETVAVYSLPYKIFEVALVVPTYFMNSVYPVMVRHLAEGKDKLKVTLSNVLKFLALAGILCGVIGIVFSPLAISILGGEEFTQSVLVLRILLGGLIFYYLTQPLSWLIVTLERQQYLPWLYLIAAVFNISVNLVLIPKYSFYGAAVTTHISEFLVLLLLIFSARKAWKEYHAL